MKLELVRAKFGKVSTLGKLYIDGVQECWTLEDVVRPRGEAKVKGKTAIPTGIYKITLRKEGGFHQRYAKRFPKTHEGMLWVRDVPGFEWILIHCGNTHEDTQGCVLVGMAPREVKGEYEISHSVDAYKQTYVQVVSALKKGEEVWLTVVGEAP